MRKIWKTIWLVFLSQLLIAFASSAYGYSYGYTSTPQLVQSSDIIVVGVATIEKGKVVVHVSEVLKGEKTERLVLNSITVGPGDVVVRLGIRGILFLRGNKAGYAPFHPACFKIMGELNAVKSAIGMFTDPGPYINLKPSSENPDVAFVLGELFSGWRISSTKVPLLGMHMARFSIKYYEVAPWTNDLVVTLECEADPEGVVRVISAQPKGLLSQFFERRLLTASRWSRVKSELRPRFSVMLDARMPNKIGSASRTDAILYLRELLSSSDPNTVAAALLALAKMRDSGAVPVVIPLLDHESKVIQIKAIQFLGCSRSELGAKPLWRLLDATAGSYPVDHATSNGASAALRKIGVNDSLPSLERAACHGVQRAIEAVGAIGRTESFDIMLKAAKSDPKRCAHMVDSFLWLVRRSNKEREAWMDTPILSKDIGAEKIPKWALWWETNKNDFKVIKSFQEALEEKRIHNK